MELRYDESFDAVMKTYRKIYPLDSTQLFFLSEFSDEHRKVTKYSVDIEEACDSHYEIDSENAAKFAFRLHCSIKTNDLVNALTVFFSKNGEHEFEEMLNEACIKHQPFHFNDYDM